MSLLNGTARGALKRGIANNEIDRPKSLCICTRYQRPVVESSFCEMRSWFVLRSRREPLHSGRLWRLRSSVCPRCISGCGGVCVFGSRFAIRLAIRRQYILGKSSKLKMRLKIGFFAAQWASSLLQLAEITIKASGLGECRRARQSPLIATERWDISARPSDNHIRP
jgi:hypothetical protein